MSKACVAVCVVLVNLGDAVRTSHAEADMMQLRESQGVGGTATFGGRADDHFVPISIGLGPPVMPIAPMITRLPLIHPTPPVRRLPPLRASSKDEVSRSIEKASSSSKAWFSLLAFDLAQRAMRGGKIPEKENWFAVKSKYPEKENWFAVEKDDLDDAEELFASRAAQGLKNAYTAVKEASKSVISDDPNVDEMQEAEEKLAELTSKSLNKAYESLKQTSKATLEAYKASIREADQAIALTAEEIKELEEKFAALTAQALKQATESLRQAAKFASKKEYGTYKVEELENMLEAKLVALTAQSFNKASDTLKEVAKGALDAYESSGWDYVDAAEKLAVVTAEKKDLALASESLGLASKSVLEAYKSLQQASRGSTGKLATLLAEKDVIFQALEDALKSYESLKEGGVSEKP